MLKRFGCWQENSSFRLGKRLEWKEKLGEFGQMDLKAGYSLLGKRIVDSEMRKRVGKKLIPGISIKGISKGLRNMIGSLIA